MATLIHAPPLIGGLYDVDVSRPLPLAGGGLPTFAASGGKSGDRALMAIRVGRHAPARRRALQTLTMPIDGLITPLAHGPGPAIDGEAGYFVICAAPPGPPLSAALRPWPEAAILQFVLRPVARALEKLAAAGITHRAIRLNNLFQASPGAPAVLGAAWAAPPAMHQPPYAEPVYSAACHEAGRGDGTIADDIYALGMVLAILALGRVPIMPENPEELIRRRLELGSYAALIGDARLPAGIADLVRGMLAEDPAHRPGLDLLLDANAARARRGPNRPPPRAVRPLTIGASQVWNGRMLARALGKSPDAPDELVRNPAIVNWTRRILGDPDLASQLEDMIRAHANDHRAGNPASKALLVMKATALLDPLAPLTWRGTAFWPDGFGDLLAALAPPDHDQQRRDMAVLSIEDALVTWAALRPGRVNLATMRDDARRQGAILRISGTAGGIPRLTYALSPMLPCLGPVPPDRWVADMASLVPALEDGALDITDPEILSFIATRPDHRLGREIQFLGTARGDNRSLGLLRLLGRLQADHHPGPLPRLAEWTLGQIGPLTARWRNKAKREAVAAETARLAGAGMLTGILALLEDPVEQDRDMAGARRAAEDLTRIDAELAVIEGGGPARTAFADRVGQEAAGALGLAVLALMLVLAALE